MCVDTKLLKVCVIGVYFGKLPNYFNIWMRSVEYNKNIDFLLVTDQIIDKLPVNLRVYSCNLNSLKNRIQSKLGYEISFEKPYKSCDFRPSFGIVFNDYLNGYDYWGYCDFDLIFGDLQSFFEKYNIFQYDRFLPMGHLGLYRNTDENNKRFMIVLNEKINYKHIFTDYHNFAFDEIGSRQIYEDYKFPFFTDRIFADISKIYKRFKLVNNDKNYDNQVFYWEDGKVFRSYIFNDQIFTEEFIYIHFKERGYLEVNGDCLTKKRFFITPQGFFASDVKDIVADDIKVYNPFRSKLFESFELLHYKFSCFISGIKGSVVRVFCKKENVR